MRALILKYLIIFCSLAVFNSYAVDSPKTLTVAAGTILPTPRILKPFELIQSDDKPFTNKNLLGQWTMLFFGFTRCAMVCPTTLAELNKMYKILERDQRLAGLKVAFVSVDPEMDNKTRLARYVNSFNKAFLGLRGSTEQLDNLTNQLGVIYAKVQMQNNKTDNKPSDTIDHSGTIALIDPEGRLYAIFTMPHQGGKLAQGFEKIVATYQ